MPFLEVAGQETSDRSGSPPLRPGDSRLSVELPWSLGNRHRAWKRSLRRITPNPSSSLLTSFSGGPSGVGSWATLVTPRYLRGPAGAMLLPDGGSPTGSPPTPLLSQAILPAAFRGGGGGLLVLACQGAKAGRPDGNHVQCQTQNQPKLPPSPCYCFLLPSYHQSLVSSQIPSLCFTLAKELGMTTAEILLPQANLGPTAEDRAWEGLRVC